MQKDSVAEDAVLGFDGNFQESSLLVVTIKPGKWCCEADEKVTAAHEYEKSYVKDELEQGKS
jgi:hypothetical protein